MGHGKETPRQKMIGMMYLVLMAMLALNVSNEVLNAFAVLDEGLQSTKKTLEQANGLVWENFETQFAANQNKTLKWYNLAKELNDKADAITKFIDDKKNEIVIEHAKEDPEKVVKDGRIYLEEVERRDVTEAPAVVMVGEGNNKAGKELQDMLNNFENWIYSDIIQEGDPRATLTKNSIHASLETADVVDKKSKEKIPWARAQFEHLPMSGVISIMTAWQINVRNAQSEALKYLYNKIDEKSFKFTNLDATVIPNSNYILRGGEYKADVFLAASDTTTKPKIYVAEGRIPYDSVIATDGAVFYKQKKGLKYDIIEADNSGKARYKISTGSTGSFNWGGIIEVIGPSGDTVRRPFTSNYMVAQASAVVSPTQMNVFYIGVDNPVDISVSGIKPEDIRASMTNGSIRKSRNGWVVNPKKPGKSFVSVNALIDGTTKNMGKKEFRVKRVPDPVAKVNGIKSGPINKQALVRSLGVQAAMENFDFNLSFKVTSFVVSATVNGFEKDAPSTSYKFTQAQRDLISGLSRGQRVYIREIKAVGPDGTVRKLSPIDLLLN